MYTKAYPTGAKQMWADPCYVPKWNSNTYVLVITCLRGMLLVYGHETRGRVAPEGGVSINRNIPIRHVLIDL